MNHLTQQSCVRRLVVRVVGVFLFFWGSLQGLPVSAATSADLADYPLFSTVKVPGNLALVLSVEWPTATTPAYLNTASYSSSTTYIGYFNPALCYKYVYNSTTPSNSYFVPVSAASSHVCSGYWSGNFMNYASMQTLDVFRSILTGGYRSTDTNTATNTSSINLDTILTKTYASSQGSYSSAPDKLISSNATTVAGATPFTWSSITTRIHKLGRRMWFVGQAYSVCTDTSSSSTCSSNSLDSATSATAWNGGTSNSTIYEVYINVAVCVNATYKEENCTKYGNVYKPEGLMQGYSSQLRYAAFSYLNRSYSSTNTATQGDGGVLRARMNYIGPTQPVPGSSDITNTTAPEWSSSTGIVYTNPASTDASATASEFGISMSASGAMNYLNKFGNYVPDNGLESSSNVYKSKDPVSELYYAAVRYYLGLNNVSDYTSGTTALYADGFPVITSWTSKDPIVYSCQKNFILGIGDVNTHRDANLYGSTLRTYVEPTMPSAVSSDTTINVSTATNMVGKLEGNSGLGSLYQFNASATAGSSTCPTSYSSSTYYQCNTYYIAGLAYHIHTNDIRSTTSGSSVDSNMSGSQTVSTYWVDVMENQKYAHKNQYWLAAKYGGFTVPSTFSPYSSSNTTTTLPDSAWYTNSSNSCGYSTTSTATFSTDSTYCGSSSTAGASAYQDKRPDNYYFGNDGSTIKTSLTSAFAKIASELSSASSTSYAMVTPNVSTGDASYSATYDPTYWTSSLIGSSVSYDSSGNATTTESWNARDLLEGLSDPNTSRYIVTYCDQYSSSGGQGVQFTSTALAACPTTGRLYYASFASISNTTSTSSTPQADYVKYLRGDRTHEIQSGSSSTSRIYRLRKYLLGDVVNSKVTAVGAPSAAFYDVYNPGYSSFKRSYVNRRTVVYAGANDGMLHAFDGTLPGYVSTTSSGTTTTTTSSCSFCGQELFAYIPSFVYGDSSTAASKGLASLGDPSRSHYYMVDATPLSFDIDLNNVCGDSTNSTSSTCAKVSSTPAWRTVLIGGLGKGGKGYYAIDVTSPGTVTSTTSTSGSTTTVTRTLTDGDWTSEANVAGKVLWEFPSSTDTTTIARMGYSYGAPTVVKTKKYGWVVVFTSGYNNSDGKGYFFIVNPTTGALLETVATSTGSTSSPVNLAQADAYISNMADYTADAIYGGDLAGNLWRLDLTPTTASYSAPTLMATLTSSAGNAQSVTTRPLIEVDTSTGKRYVLVGTGRLLADSDIKSSTVQAIYSIYDGTSGYGNFLAASNFSTPLTYSSLNAVTDLTSGISSASTNVNGWYYNLGVDSSTSIAERMNVNPVAYSGVAAFGVNLPDGSVCSPAGSGYVLAINIATGKTVLQDSSGNLIASSAMSGVITDLALQNVNGTIRLIVGDSKSNTVTMPTSLNTSSGLTRVNWRVVPTD